MSQRRSLRHGARIQNLSIEVFEVYGYIDTERLKGGAVVNIGWKLMLFQSAKLEILEFDGFDRRLDLIWDKMNLHRGPHQQTKVSPKIAPWPSSLRCSERPSLYSRGRHLPSSVNKCSRILCGVDLPSRLTPDSGTLAAKVLR